MPPGFDDLNTRTSYNKAFFASEIGSRNNWGFRRGGSRMGSNKPINSSPNPLKRWIDKSSPMSKSKGVFCLKNK